MEFVRSFEVTKIKKAYVVKVKGLHPKGKSMIFHVDSGASVTVVGLNSLCDKDDTKNYEQLKAIIEREISKENLEPYAINGSTVTEEQIKIYPCRYEGVSISETIPITLYFYIHLGNVSMPLLGFDYIDDTSYHHSIAGDLFVNGVAEEVGKRFYPLKVLDFNSIMDEYKHSIVDI